MPADEQVEQVEAADGQLALLAHEGAAEQRAQHQHVVGDEQVLAVHAQRQHHAQQLEAYVSAGVLVSRAGADWMASLRCSEGKRLTMVKSVPIALAPFRMRMSCSRLYSTIF